MKARIVALTLALVGAATMAAPMAAQAAVYVEDARQNSTTYGNTEFEVTEEMWDELEDLRETEDELIHWLYSGWR